MSVYVYARRRIRPVGQEPGSGGGGWFNTLPLGITAVPQLGQFTPLGTAWQPGALNLADYPNVIFANTATELQNAIATCPRGSRIVLRLAADAQYSTTDGFRLHPKAGAGGVLICSEAIHNGTFPKAAAGYNQRATAADAAAMSRIICTSSGASACFAGGTTLRGWPGMGPDMRGYRFAGLHATNAGSNAPTTLFLELQSNREFQLGELRTYNGIADEPSEFVIDRCLIENVSTVFEEGPSFGLTLVGRRFAVVGTSILNMMGAQSNPEPKGILIAAGSGQHYIDNVHAEGLGISIFVGGQSYHTVEFRPDNGIVRRSRFYMRPEWMTSPRMKNLCEMKTGRFWLWEGNVFENQNGQAQAYALMLYGVNQDSVAAFPAQAHWVGDVTMRYCDFRNVFGSFNLPLRSAFGPNMPMNRLYLGHVAFDCDPSRFLQSQLQEVPQDSVLEHITHAIRGTPTSHAYTQLGSAPPADPASTGFRFRYNVGTGVFRTDTANGLANNLALGFAPQSTWTRNLHAGDLGATVGDNINVASQADIGFTNVAQRNLRLTNQSPGKGQAPGGLDLGADWDGMAALTAGCVSGNWS